MDLNLLRSGVNFEFGEIGRSTGDIGGIGRVMGPIRGREMTGPFGVSKFSDPGRDIRRFC